MVLTRASREFKQKRAQETYARLLDAAQVVFARRGYDAAQTPEIAAEAGVSTGAFYRYFADKRQVFVEMIARYLARAHGEVTQKLDPRLFVGGSVRQAIDQAIAVLFQHIRRDNGLERVYLAQSLKDDEVQMMRAEYEARGLDALTTLIRAIVPREVVPSARAAALVISLGSLEVAAERAGLRPRLSDRVSDAEVRRALGDMVERYLFPVAATAAKPARKKR